MMKKRLSNPEHVHQIKKYNYEMKEQMQSVLLFEIRVKRKARNLNFVIKRQTRSASATDLRFNAVLYSELSIFLVFEARVLRFFVVLLFARQSAFVTATPGHVTLRTTLQVFGHTVRIFGLALTSIRLLFLTFLLLSYSPHRIPLNVKSFCPGKLIRTDRLTQQK